MMKNKKDSFLLERNLGKKMNKKGAEMTVGTIIIIVLALIVLVVLVVGFTGGWTNLWGRISNFFGGGSNVDSIVQACQVACTTNQKYEFCDRMRTIKAEENVLFVHNQTNNTIVSSTWEGAVQSKEGKASCKILAELHSTLGFVGCSDLC